ncbi:hypothetical protein LTR56_014071 [Elasticomyces elasticus]|nr:hypothetical protein LTR56_014071 [Elasticomyces elasticus]
MPLPIFTKAEWDAWFDANPQDEEQGDAPLGGEMRTASLPLRESTPQYEDRRVILNEQLIGAGRVEFDAHLRAEGKDGAPLGGEMVSTSLPPRESTPRYEDRRVFNNERVTGAATSAYGDMTAVPPTRPLRAEGQGDAPLGGYVRSTTLVPRENRARRKEMDAPPPRPLRAKRPGDAPLRGERRISPRRPRESTPRYEDRPVPSTERYIAAGTSAYDDVMAAPPPRSRNEAELAAKLAEFQAYLRAEAQRNAPLGGVMRSTPQRPSEKRARREEQPVQSTEWNSAAGRFECGAGIFTHGNMMAASPPTPRSEGFGGPMTMPTPQWRVDLVARQLQRRRDMALDYPLDLSPTMSQPPPPGMAILHPPGEPQANFASTLPHRPGPGIARGYNLGAAPTMSQPPAFGMAGGHAPASPMEHSAFGQPGPFQDMPGDPSPDDWVSMGFSGNPKMMMEANAFAMLSPQDLASAPAAQASGSRGPYAQSHHPYQPHSDPTLQTDNHGHAPPYGHMQPTQLPMDPQQMYHVPSFSPVANTMAPQASVHAAPYRHSQPTQSYVDHQQAFRTPSIPPVTNNYNIGTPVQGNQQVRDFSGNAGNANGTQFHAATPGTTLPPSNHTDNRVAKRSKPAGPPLKETTIHQWDPNCLKNRKKHITNLNNEDKSYKSVGVIYVDAGLFNSQTDKPDEDEVEDH